LPRDLAEPIKELIKLDQQDEATVQNEITEDAATDRKDPYMEVLPALADALGDPAEGAGVEEMLILANGRVGARCIVPDDGQRARV
jgi:hypothetical protein